MAIIEGSNDVHCDATPGWFTEAISTSAATGVVPVKGCPISYRTWGRPGAPGIVLVHGGAAHARWWDHVAPLLAAGGRHHVVAVDLSGHGDSGWREVYSLDTWADEALSASTEAGVTEPPVLVGHSMGGFVGIAAAARHADRLAGAIIVDAPVRRPDPESEEARHGSMFRRPKVYDDLDTAVTHFHLVPPQPAPAGYIVAHVASHSLRRTEAGWSWKFDPRIFVEREEPEAHNLGNLLSQIGCRVAVLHGGLSQIVDADVTDYMSERLGRTAPFVEIPQAHHHLILDQPLAFVTAVRALLADWEHSVPYRLPSRA